MTPAAPGDSTSGALLARRWFDAALAAVDPERAVLRHGASIEQRLERLGVSRVRVAAFGKAAYPMARAASRLLGPRIDTGAMVTKYGHAGPASQITPFEVFEGGHPIPDERGLTGTRAIVGVLEPAGSEHLVVCLISGGGSALLVSPAEGLTLEQKQQTTDLLLRAGADIGELNAVRKHISSVKGGRLAELAAPAEVISLIVSDVIGDRLDVISSGPTAPDPTTYGEALDVLRRHGVSDQAPVAVIRHLKRGIAGELEETPSEENALFSRVENLIIASNRAAIDAAAEAAAGEGWPAEAGSAEISGDARRIAAGLARRALEHRGERRCLVSGGETTVRVVGDGKGGRNMELALAFAIEIDGAEGVTLLSAGTDGTDGPTDAAGAIVDGRTARRAREMGLDPVDYLHRNDSYHFFREVGGLLITGPTGTNVMDLQILLLGEP